MRVLVAGPGTGKTTGIKGVLADDYESASRILVLSFTNATVNDLRESFRGYGQVECHTLHSYALKINPGSTKYILSRPDEEDAITRFASALDIDVEELCRQLDCVTFDAMISRCASFLEDNPIYGQDQIGALDLLIVDEYQDFNGEERRLLNLISGFAAETIVLGDDDQSIYGFKDADPDGIISLYESDGVSHIDHHHNCFRCPDVVVEGARRLIEKNKNRIDKPWNPTGKDGILYAHQVRTLAESARFVVDQISQIRADEEAEGSEEHATIMVLGPMRWYVAEQLERLEAEGVDYVDFWTPAVSREEYEAVWWSRVILSRRRLLNLVFLSSTLTAHFKRKFKKEVGDGLHNGVELDVLADQVLPMFSGELATLAQRAPNIDDLTGFRPGWSHILDLLDPAKLAMSLDDLVKNLTPDREFSKDAVNVMSIHKSKGLQADVVFITGLVDGILPNNDRGLDTIEAQRRLLFVGMTRALQALYLISPIEWEGRVANSVDKSQFKYNYRSKKYLARASRFISDLR